MRLTIAILACVAVSVTSGYAGGYMHLMDTVNDPGDLLGQTNAITTAVPFLSITPDARHAGMGDAGVASSPDANASYWNPAKLVYVNKAYGGTISYTPWLGKIINDMSISYLSGFYKITREQAASFSLKYFDLGEIFFTDDGKDGTNYNPREFALDFTYSRKLTEEFSVGLTGRYIHSNLTGNFTYGGVDAQPGKSVAVDIGVFYTKELQSAKNSSLSFGGSISNIGAKMTYSDEGQKDFIPTNLRLGSAFTTSLDEYNTLTFLLDFNKLMVPTIDEGQSMLSGMFSSFADAPGGFSEEMREIMLSMGTEYWYNELFAARLGYFLEAYDKGNRKYLTVGTGFRKNHFGFDVAYIVPTNKREHPLAETLRFTLLFQISETDRSRDQTVTE
jgi:hypothetical protein